MDLATHNQQDTTTEAGLFAVCRALLAAGTVEDLVEIAPRVIAEHLPLAAGYQVVLIDPVSLNVTPETGDLHQVCIPMQYGNRLVGGIVIDAGTDGVVLTDATQRALEQIAELLATAIVTRQRIADEQRSLLDEAAELKLDIVSMLSHEMRTPLASIKGYATALLLDDVEWDDASRVEFLTAIDEESDHLARLITDMLDSAAIEAGEITIVPEPILVPRIVKRVVDNMQIRSDTHRFIVIFPDEFPVIEADAQRIEQVLTNLLDNAMKYSPNGGLIVVRGEVSEREVIISVSDQGIGIAPEHLNKLFERFFRARSSAGPQVSGTGLGLPISDAIVRAFGGRIWAESTLGSGTTLSFTIPRDRSDGADG
ncbi:MAG TPA: ATP-binding protein [Thermomicrobiales bacterium]|nr:ATP-binding protein [Thermomicrobiales bacterium]